MPYHTVPFGLPCHSFTTDSTEASFNGGPMHLPTRVGRKGRECIQVLVMRGTPIILAVRVEYYVRG